MLNSRSEGAGCSEDVAQLEVELPARSRSSEDVLLVESVRYVDSQRPQRRHHRRPESGTPEQAGGGVLANSPINGTGVQEGIDVKRATDRCSGFHRKGRKRLTECIDAGRAAAGVRIVPVWGYGELVIAPERNPELNAAHRI